MIRFSLTVTFFAAALGITLGVTALPRPKPVGDEIPQPVVYAPVVIPEIPEPSATAKLDALEDRVRMIQRKVDRIEAKAEGK